MFSYDLRRRKKYPTIWPWEYRSKRYTHYLRLHKSDPDKFPLTVKTKVHPSSSSARGRLYVTVNHPYGKYPWRLRRLGHFRGLVIPSRFDLTVRITGTFGPSIVKQYVYSKTSSKTANYWNLFYNGQRDLIPPHPFTEFVVSQNTPIVESPRGQWLSPTQFFQYDPWYVTIQNLGLPSNWDATYAIDSGKMDNLSNKLLQKISDRRASIGEFVGEFHKTFEMFNSTAKRVLRAVTALKHGNLLAVASALSYDLHPKELKRLERIKSSLKPSLYVSNMWLEYIYGWKPLLSDTVGLATALTDNIVSSSLIKSVRKRSVEVEHTLSNTGDAHSRTVSKSVTTSKHFITVRYKVSNPNTHLQQQLQLLDPLDIAWNLIPYSFIVDWFFQFHEYLELLNATSGLTFLDGSKGVNIIHQCDCYHVGEFYSWPDTSVGLAGTQPGHNLTRFKLRQVLGGFPDPVLQRGPGLTLTRGLTSLALLRQRFK